MTEDLFTAYPLEDYKKHQASIDAALSHALKDGHYILGANVKAFEDEFASFVGTRHCIGVANGTDSIEIILRALQIGRGSVVAVPSQTAVASVSAISRAGATPVFVDVEPDTFVISAQALDQIARSPEGRNLKAVLAVHLYGHPVDLASIQAVCDEHGLKLIEDCAQSHGARFLGRSVGTFGCAASFSFYPTKNLGAIGDGGAITTNDTELADRMQEIRQYGWRVRYISAVEGVNSRLDELQAAILRVKIPFLAENNQRRQQLAQIYSDELIGSILIPPISRANCEHVYHLYVTRCKQRDQLMKHLNKNGIPAALHYPAAVHQQPAYTHIARSSPSLPVTDALVPEILSLPLHPYLSEQAVRETIRVIRSF